MNKFKNIAFAAFLAIGAFSVVTYTSCTKDECKDVVCNNGGTCAGGSCSCPAGYEGTNCDSKTRDKFVGTWQGQDICTSKTYTISLTIGASSDDVKVIVNNPGGFGTPINIQGTVTNSTSLAFTNQNVGNGRILNGTMSFTGGTTTTLPTGMTFAYSVVGPLDSDNCNGSYTRL